MPHPLDEMPPPSRLVRVIGRLDIKGPNVIKGVHLEGLRVVGNPGSLARAYYAAGIDELLYMDAVASLYERNSILPLVEAAAREVFVPLTVGGGIRSLDDIQAALSSGADKVAINTAALRNPEFIDAAARAFGSQCVVLSVEAKRRTQGWEALVDNGRERTGQDVVEWAVEAVRRGAGELLVTSVDNEGTRAGFDHDLFQAVQSAVSVPVIGCGGAGRTDDLVRAFAQDGLEAVAVASLLHYELASVPEMKQMLTVHGIGVRPC
jgi:imidazole glycerol-phosphate synthase subunit HisF